MRSSVIVCPTNASPGARAAIAQAAALARVRYAELHLLYLPREAGSRPRGTHGEEEVHPVITAAIRSMLDAARGRGQHVRFRIKAQHGEPLSAIGLYARRHRAGLIVISATYRSPRGAAGLPLARSLGRSAPCPVLVVAGTGPHGNRVPRASFGQVVCAVDFTKVSVSALEALAALSQRGRGRLTLVHCVENIGGMAFSASEAARVARAHARHATAASERLLGLVPAAALKRYRVRVIVETGPPYRRIVEVASEIKADLIVMGMPRRSRVDEWLGGSTSRAVLRRARSPVLLVPA
jgi:nucleotide-binding universal stress UspA family protein